MDYHGSKSITGLNVPQVANKLVIVKEQRVDGSCIESNTFLSDHKNVSMLSQYCD